MHFIEIEIYGKFEICFVTKELFLSNQPEVVTILRDMTFTLKIETFLNNN